MSVRSWSKEFFDLLALESVYGVQGEQVLHRWQLWMRDAFAWSRVFRVTCRSIRRESAASQFKMSKTFLIVHRVPVPLQNPNLVRPLIGDCSFFLSSASASKDPLHLTCRRGRRVDCSQGQKPFCLVRFSCLPHRSPPAPQNLVSRGCRNVKIPSDHVLACWKPSCDPGVGQYGVPSYRQRRADDNNRQRTNSVEECALSGPRGDHRLSREKDEWEHSKPRPGRLPSNNPSCSV